METNWMLPEGTLIWDRTQETEQGDVLRSFALDELLSRQVGEGAAPMVHLWRHPRAFVMGLRDSRLAHAREGKRWLESQGYSVAVRNSGGSAVPLDLDVVNLSLIMPKKQGQIDFRHDFETMYQLIREALLALSPDVAKGEVKGSYCPGDYDLSVGGRKFCGIAQRRQAHALAVQAFVVVRGAGESRAALAREFYQRAIEGNGDGQCYPKVKDSSMASLEQLIGLTEVKQFVDSIKQVVRERCLQGEVKGTQSLRLPDERQIVEMMTVLRARYGLDSD